MKLNQSAVTSSCSEITQQAFGSHQKKAKRPFPHASKGALHAAYALTCNTAN